MKRLLLVVLLLLPLQVLLGQDFAANMNGTKLKTKHPVNKETTAREYKWEFYSPDLDSYTKPTTSVADGSRFDTSLSPLVDMFNKNYTDQEPIAPGNPATRIVIRKLLFTMPFVRLINTILNRWLVVK
ncbi:hypothetical protein [Prolixibacter bellariivorans]|uniref:hypothetical protein n=1 Tax=Prolixibacter bellariivorans TaxID=314319 RepID=UPI000471B99D|nr:hypothetical protein [Prolixibacter bellariivorans]